MDAIIQDILFKKYQGYPAAYLLSSIISEPPFYAATSVISANEQLYSDSIPGVAPALTDLSHDLIFPSSLGERHYTKSGTTLAYYIKYPLEGIQLTSSGDKFTTYWAKGTTFANPKANKLRYAIPTKYDPRGSYRIIVYIDEKNGLGDNETPADSNNKWFFDADTGILTFPNGINITYDVKITFWRYEGRFGFQAVGSTAQKFIFDGGSPSTNLNQYASAGLDAGGANG